MFKNSIYSTCTNLFESKNSAKRRYLDTGKISKEDFALFLQADPSPQKKLVEWLINMYLTDELSKNHATDLAKQFYEESEAQRLPQKDINAYKSVQELEDALAAVQAKKLEKSGEKERGADYEVLVDNEVIRITHPKSYEAMRKFGQNTKWCVATSNPQYWQQYVTEGMGEFYVIEIKQISNKKINQKAVKILLSSQEDDVDTMSFAWLVCPTGFYQVYDRFDERLSEDEILVLNSIIKDFGVTSKEDFKKAPTEAVEKAFLEAEDTPFRLGAYGFDCVWEDEGGYRASRTTKYNVIACYNKSDRWNVSEILAMGGYHREVKNIYQGWVNLAYDYDKAGAMDAYPNLIGGWNMDENSGMDMWLEVVQSTDVGFLVDSDEVENALSDIRYETEAAARDYLEYVAEEFTFNDDDFYIFLPEKLFIPVDYVDEVIQEVASQFIGDEDMFDAVERIPELFHIDGTPRATGITITGDDFASALVYHDSYHIDDAPTQMLLALHEEFPDEIPAPDVARQSKFEFANENIYKRLME